MIVEDTCKMERGVSTTCGKRWISANKSAPTLHHSAVEFGQPVEEQRAEGQREALRGGPGQSDVASGAAAF
jgi:hypothetical protein